MNTVLFQQRRPSVAFRFCLTTVVNPNNMAVTCQNFRDNNSFYERKLKFQNDQKEFPDEQNDSSSQLPNTNGRYHIFVSLFDVAIIIVVLFYSAVCPSTQMCEQNAISNFSLGAQSTQSTHMLNSQSSKLHAHVNYMLDSRRQIIWLK